MSSDKVVRVKLFASAREAVGKKELTVELDGEKTGAELVDELTERYPGLKDIRQQLIIALNKSTGNQDEVLKDGDEISILPPVSGG